MTRSTTVGVVGAVDFAALFLIAFAPKRGCASIKHPSDRLSRLHTLPAPPTRFLPGSHVFLESVPARSADAAHDKRMRIHNCSLHHADAAEREETIDLAVTRATPTIEVGGGATWPCVRVCVRACVCV